VSNGRYQNRYNPTNANYESNINLPSNDPYVSRNPYTSVSRTGQNNHLENSTLLTANKNDGRNTTQSPSNYTGYSQRKPDYHAREPRDQMRVSGMRDRSYSGLKNSASKNFGTVSGKDFRRSFCPNPGQKYSPNQSGLKKSMYSPGGRNYQKTHNPMEQSTYEGLNSQN
jgi:hypothetical protein